MLLTRIFKTRLGRGAAVLSLAVGLSACASFNQISSEVSSYGAWPAERQPSTFAFERLPSQSKDAERHLQLERAASAALEQAGFKRVDDLKAADITVMVGARITKQELSPWDDPFWWQYRSTFWRHSPLLRPRPYELMDTRRYEREVALVLRDRQSGEALYEVRASNDGPSIGSAELMFAMFAAAMKDFPRTVSEPHNVAVPVAPSTR